MIRFERLRYIPYPRLTLVAAALFLVFMLSTARAVYASVAGEHVIRVHDEGQTVGFYTNADTLKDALEQADIRLDSYDRTEPSLDTELDAGSYEVNVYRARPVTIRDGVSEVKVLSAYRTPRQVVEHAGITIQKEDVVSLAPARDAVLDGAAEVLTIDRALAFTFDFYGKTNPAYTQGKTVGDMLKEKDITLGVNDVVVPDRSTPMQAGMLVRLYRDGKQTVTQEEDVPFETDKIQDADKDIGFKEVKTPGQNGRRTVTYEIVMENGVEVSRKEVNSTVIKQPVKQVEIVGTKSKNVFSGEFAEAMARLRQCESGGNYANKRNPSYRGAYQFGYTTWGNYGGFYDPADAPPPVQDQAALELYQRRGWQPWPHCTQKLGLQDIYR